MKLVIELDYYDEDDEIATHQVKIEIPQRQEKNVQELINEMRDYENITLTAKEEK